MGRFAELALLAGVGSAREVRQVASIDAMKHDIQQVYPGNFDSVIGNALPLTVSSVLYFRGSKAADAAYIETYNEVAKKTKKMLKVVAMDCDESVKQCERVGVKDTPHLQIYPQTPQPHFKYEGAMESEAIIKQLYRMIPGDRVQAFKDVGEFNAFKKKAPTKPKILLFSDKKKAPTILKALSTDSVFARTVDFAFVGPESQEVASEAGASKKKLPAVMMVNKGKTTWYKEKDLGYIALHDWININSESGMGDTVKSADGSTETQPEEPEYEKVRELHAKSQHELCFKQKNVCAIYLAKGALGDKAADMVNSFESKFAPKSDRGIKFNWMWMDVEQEPEFASTLKEMEAKQAEKEERDIGEVTYPTMIFVKPPKKKREERLLSYVKLSSGSTPSPSTVGDIIETIAGGTTYLRADLPKFAVRAKKDAKKKTKEEL